MRLIFALLLLVSYASNLHASYPLKILGLFPHPGISHFHFFHPIMRGLAEAGHHVTVVSHFPDKSPVVRYRDIPLTGKETLINAVDLKIFQNRRFYHHFTEFFLLHEWAKDACNHTLRSNALAQVLRERVKYDVIIIEMFNTDCMLGVAHVLKAPVIGLSSCALMPWHQDRIGNPIIPSFIPTLFMGYSEQMSFRQRVSNWIAMHGMKFLYNYYRVASDDALLRYKFGHDMPSVSELAKNTSMMFVNQHFSLSGAKPLSPAVKELGGIHIQKAKALSPDLQRLLDNATHGVIFISWGSMIRAESLPAIKRDGILKAVKRLKQQVIWKWENETLPDMPDNMYISKWLPQRDILCHPNVKVFMTHAGLMGSSEAAYCGVPVIATPMYGDQFLNAAALVQRGMGVVLPYEDISENTVMRSIKKVLDKSFMDNAKAISHSFKTRPQTALQTAVWWVEYVGNTKGAPLIKPYAVNLSAFVYYSLDVHLFLAILLALTFFSWSRFARLLSRRKPKDDRKKNN